MFLVITIYSRIGSKYHNVLLGFHKRRVSLWMYCEYTLIIIITIIIINIIIIIIIIIITIIIIIIIITLTKKILKGCLRFLEFFEFRDPRNYAGRAMHSG